MKKKLIILTDNFGLNFSGGAIATCRIFEPIQDDFSEMIVIANQIGQHPFKNITFLQYSNRSEAIRHIKLYKNDEDVIFYGDFYMTYYYILANVPYYFTYHDNWPEQKYLSMKNRIKSLFYIPLYRFIIKKSKHTATVSEFKLDFISKWNKNTSLIRNGINTSITKENYLVYNSDEKLNIMMLGNIESRKFGLLPKLLKMLQANHLLDKLEIDIFGNVLDKNLSLKIENYKNVVLKGFTNNVNFAQYHILLSTSRMENLSLAVVEAIANYTPVVCFDVGGLKEVVMHKKNGFLIAKDNVSRMAEAITEVVGGHTNFDFNQEDLSEYDWKIAAEKYKKILFAI